MLVHVKSFDDLDARRHTDATDGPSPKGQIVVGDKDHRCGGARPKGKVRLPRPSTRRAPPTKTGEQDLRLGLAGYSPGTLLPLTAGSGTRRFQDPTTNTIVPDGTAEWVLQTKGDRWR